jgi:hypothetical protein
MSQREAAAAVDEPEVEQRERYRELLEELRTIIPGVQVLFAFLLTAPFAARFAEVDRIGRVAFLVSILAAAVAIVLFLTPTSYHRIATRTERLERIRLAVRTALLGLASLAVAITAGLFVVVRFVFGADEAQWIGGGLALAIVGLWLGLPLWRRVRHAES